MVSLSTRQVRLGVATGVSLVLACSSEAPTRPGTDTGTLRVLVKTTGASLDADGYSLRVGASDVVLQVQDSLDIVNLSVGETPLVLSGLANNCRAFSSPPANVVIETQDTVRIPLLVSCDSALRNVILFDHWPTDRTPELWLMQPDGTGKQLLAAGARSGAATPDGTRVIYEDWAHGGISIMLADRSRRWNPLPDLHATIVHPDISPDGQSVVVAAAEFGAPVWDLYRANLDGSDIRRLTTGADAVQPRWSPDGRFIAYHTQGSDFRVYIIPSEGGEAVPLRPRGRGCCVSWSPAGDRLLFYDVGLWTMRPDGSDAASLEPFRYAVAGEWSPDGAEIAAKFGGTILRMPLEGWEGITLSNEPRDVVSRWLR